jgi:hypothetical protein
MALDIDYFLKINNCSGTTSKKDTLLYDLHKQINDRFADTIDFYTISKSGINQDLIIVRTTDENKKNIKARPHEDFLIGDIITWENNDWIIISKDEGNQVYTSGKMQRCNLNIKFQNTLSGVILSYPIIDTTNSTLGLDVNKTITTTNGLHTIKLPFDEHTNTLVEDRRIYLDRNTVNPRSYKITKVNNTEFNYGDKGLIELALQQCEQGEPDDRPDLGICNYQEPTITPEIPDDSTYAVITCSNIKNEITLGSSVFRTLTPVFYESDGAISTANIIPEWTFDFNGFSESNFTIVYEGNKLKIKVNDNYDLLGVKITVNVSDGNNSYKGSIQLLLIS